MVIIVNKLLILLMLQQGVVVVDVVSLDLESGYDELMVV